MKTNLVALSHYVSGRIHDRLSGLTDEEYLWEPVPNCWSVRRGAAGFRLDGEWPPPDPPPFTTIGWRVGHLIDIYQAERTATWLGLTPQPDDEAPVAHGTAAEALAALDHAAAVWHRRLDAVDEETLRRPMGGVAGHYGEQPAVDFVLHILDEVIHHGAEVGVLRDLYRAQ